MHASSGADANKKAAVLANEVDTVAARLEEALARAQKAESALNEREAEVRALKGKLDMAEKRIEQLEEELG